MFKIYKPSNKRLLLYFITLSLATSILLIVISTSSKESNWSINSTEEKKMILMWTPFWGTQNYFELIKFPNSPCSNLERCIVTYYHSLLPKADAVVFHASDISVKMVENLPEAKDKFKVFYTLESVNMLLRHPVYKHLSKLPRNYFHLTMTFSLKSDVYGPYGNGYFVPPEVAVEKGFPSLGLPYDSETILKDKKIKGALWFVSDCDTYNKREDAVKALSKYMRIDIGGACGDKDKDLCPLKDSVWFRRPSCDEVINKYYFYFAIENDNCNEYISEKYWHHYKLPVILVVMRRRIYEKVVPPNFIALDDFSGPKQMAEYLNFLMENPDAYMKLFEWRSHNWALAPPDAEGYMTGMCSLCDKLWKNSTTMPETIPNVLNWFEDVSDCAHSEEFTRKWID